MERNELLSPPRKALLLFFGLTLLIGVPPLLPYALPHLFGVPINELVKKQRFYVSVCVICLFFLPLLTFIATAALIPWTRRAKWTTLFEGAALLLFQILLLNLLVSVSGFTLNSGP